MIIEWRQGPSHPNCGLFEGFSVIVLTVHQRLNWVCNLVVGRRGGWVG